MLRLASADRWSRGPGDTPAPRSSPNDVSPPPSPHAAFPVGNTTVSADARTGEPAVGNARNASAESGRPPMPLLDTELPPTTSESPTHGGVAGQSSHRA